MSLLEILKEMWDDFTWIGRFTILPIIVPISLLMVLLLLALYPLFMFVDKNENKLALVGGKIRAMFYKNGK